MSKSDQYADGECWVRARPFKTYAAACERVASVCSKMRYASRDVRIHKFSLACAPAHGRIALHRHSHYEALLTLNGAADELEETGGRLVPGTLQLNVPGRRHGWVAPTGIFDRMAVTFTLIPDVPDTVISRWPVDLKALGEARALLEDAANPTPGHVNRIRARMLLLLARFFDLLEWREPVAPSGDSPGWSLGKLVRQFLRDNLDQPLELADIATVAHVSVPTLTRRFRTETGQAVMAHLTELRMEKAAELLRGTRLSVKAVAKEVGYVESTYFCRRFRARYDCSPLAYRDEAPRKG